MTTGKRMTMWIDFALPDDTTPEKALMNFKAIVKEKAQVSVKRAFVHEGGTIRREVL
jgi:hypothetical protein